MTKGQLIAYKKANQLRKSRMLKRNYKAKNGGFPVALLGGVIQKGKYSAK